MQQAARRVDYEDRLLAFIDILGWKRHVERSLFDQTAQELVSHGIDVIQAGMGIQHASEKGAAFGKKYDADAKYSFFSDTFIVSTPAKSTNFLYFSMGVANVCCQLLVLGLASRGAVVAGKLIHDGNRVYGPSLASAAHIEKCEAVSPRILVTPEASAFLSPYASLKRDDDGLEYLDVLHGRVLNRDHSSLETMLCHAQANLATAKGDERVEPKYLWLTAYIRRAQEEAKAEELKPSTPLDLG